MSLSIIIIEKGGSLKTLTVKEYNESELYKKCGFKKDDGFAIRTEWSKIKIDGRQYSVSVFAKINGKANMENKYDFPPPIDNDLYFGSCALVCKIKDIESGDYTYCPLTIDLWNKIYEKLFGGFENLADTCYEDEHEIDELANIPADKKTKTGYLKDGFVVSDNSSDDKASEVDLDVSSEDIGSELSEESYED